MANDESSSVRQFQAILQAKFEEFAREIQSKDDRIKELETKLKESTQHKDELQTKLEKITAEKEFSVDLIDELKAKVSRLKAKLTKISRDKDFNHDDLIDDLEVKFQQISYTGGSCDEPTKLEQHENELKQRRKVK